jgi:lipopolysaccharide export LptBFGC system permease protein LptF
VFIALPFGALSSQRNVFVGVAASIFIVFAYYVVMSVGMAFGARGWLPPRLAAGCPTLPTGTAIGLIRRVQ